MGALFEHLRNHNLKLSPSKARPGGTDADFLGHSISPAGVRPNAVDRKFLRSLSRRIRPITSLLRKGIKFEITPAVEVIEHEILAELPTPPILVFSDWEAITDGSRAFHVYSDAYIYGFGAVLEQNQPDDSVRPIAYITRVTLDSERHWTPLDLEAGSIVWAIKRLRDYLWGRKLRIFSDQNTLESIGKVGDHIARVQR